MNLLNSSTPASSGRLRQASAGSGEAHRGIASALRLDVINFDNDSSQFLVARNSSYPAVT